MRRPHRLPHDSPPLPLHEPPNAAKSPAPPIVVECWCTQVETMDRERLDQFTRDIWRRFDAVDLEPLKRAILRRRETLSQDPSAGH